MDFESLKKEYTRVVLNFKAWFPTFKERHQKVFFGKGDSVHEYYLLCLQEYRAYLTENGLTVGLKTSSIIPRWTSCDSNYDFVTIDEIWDDFEKFRYGVQIGGGYYSNF